MYRINQNLIKKMIKNAVLLLATIFAILQNSVATAFELNINAATHTLAKRMDLESCLVRFDVHLNTIIRTEESRSMGAKFLDDADLSSQEQCLRLCCETEGCDVFVFEEKSQGTCFLFQCGPPENFRCKFTRHANYTSAVFSSPPPPPLQPPSELQQQPQTPPPPPIKLSQHELELANLKIPRGETTTTTTTIIPPLGVRLGQELITTTTLKTPPTKCGLFQFPCHSGECIAVYNACDGIPQCEDGSDEGPECPTPSIKNIIQPAPQQTNLQPSIPKQMPPLIQRIQYQEQQIPVMQQPPPPPHQLQMQQQQHQIGQRPILHNREDPISASKQWPHQQSDIQGGYIEPSDSRIFNHKGGLQLATNNMQPQYQDPMQDNNYGPLARNPYMPSSPQDQYRSPLQWAPEQRLPSPRLDWPQQQILPQETYMQQQPDVNMQQQQQSNQNIPRPQKTWPSIRLNVSTPIAESPEQTLVDNKKQELPQKPVKEGSDEYESENDEEYADVEEEPPKKKHKHRKHEHEHDHEEKKEKKIKNKNKTTKKAKHEEGGSDKPSHEHFKMLKNDLDMEFKDHDGQAERPGGAVLSLTLGVIITAALAVLVGCRMRVAGRRVRRAGKGAYAHDADFLVNGMYL